MLTVCGSDLQLGVDKILCQSDGCFLGAATDETGQRWLVLHRRAPDAMRWWCAAVSTRMLEELEAGRAAAGDVFRHSLTGTVEIVSAGARGEQSRDRCVCCAQLPEAWIADSACLPPPRARRRRKRSAPSRPPTRIRRRHWSSKTATSW
jgi:hypothetical protein